MKRTLLLSIAVFVCTSGNVSAGTQFDNGYIATYLGDFRPTAINNSGQVVGSQETSIRGLHKAVLWDGTNGLQDLGGLEGIDGGSYARDINNSGQVVGNHDGIPFIWDSENGMQELSRLGSSYGFAKAINDSGQIVGESKIAGLSSDSHAVLWGNGNITDLGTLGGNESRANDINNNGQIVGSYYWESENSMTEHAFLWDSQNGMQDIHPDPGDLWDTPSGEAWNTPQTTGAVINDSGVIGVNFQHATFLLENDTWTYVTGPYGASSSFVKGINNVGMVVGDDVIGVSWFWENGETTEWWGERFADINDRGQIVAWNDNGAYLIEIPEPTTLLLMGLGTLALRSRRSR